MRRRLGPQVGDVDVAVRVALDRHHLHARHHRAGRIGAVGRLGNEAGGAVGVAAGAVVGPDHQQAGVLALGAGVGLQRHRREAGDLRQLVLQLAEEQLVARGLVARRERMQPVELAPAHRHHLGRGVELHGAGAERDHRRGEREVARLEPLDVAQHLGLGVVPVEDRVRQVASSCARAPAGMARSGLRADVLEHERQRLVEREDRDQVGQVAQGDGLVERDAEPGGRERPQVDLPGPGGVQQAGQGPLAAPRRRGCRRSASCTTR